MNFIMTVIVFVISTMIAIVIANAIVLVVAIVTLDCDYHSDCFGDWDFGCESASRSWVC